MSIKDDRLTFKCFKCKKNYKKEIIKRFENTQKFCNGDFNKFTLLLRKGVYPYEYVDCWEIFDETSLPDKKSFHINLNINSITGVNYRHGKRGFKGFIIKNLSEYHDLYVQCGTLLLADVFEKFRNKCIEICKLDHILSAPVLTCQACFKKIRVELELSTDIDMLLMAEKGIKVTICHAIHRYAKANNKYMNKYDKNVISSYLMYLDTTNLYG